MLVRHGGFAHRGRCAKRANERLEAMDEQHWDKLRLRQGALGGQRCEGCHTGLKTVTPPQVPAFSAQLPIGIFVPAIRSSFAC